MTTTAGLKLLHHVDHPVFNQSTEGIHPKRILLFSLIGITLYGVVTAGAIASGMNWFSNR